MAEASRFETFEQGGLTYVCDPSLEGLREQEAAVHEVFEGLVKPHIEASDGLLSLIPYDPEAHPAERLDVVEVRSANRADISILEDFATTAYAGYPKIRKEYQRDEHADLFSTVLLDLEEGRHYVFLFDHGRIINTPLGGISTMGALEHQAQALGKNVPPYHARITASKILSRVSALGMNAVDLLSLVGIADMSIPPTVSVERAGISPKMRRVINASLKDVRVEFEEEHEGEAVADILSASASTDVVVRHFMRHHVHMHPVSGGTTDMLMRSRTLLASLNVDKSNPRIKIGRIFNPSHDRLEAHSHMIQLAQLVHESTGMEAHYHTTKDSYERAIVGRKRL